MNERTLDELEAMADVYDGFDPDTVRALIVRIREFETSIWWEAATERDRAHAKHGDTSMESSDPLDPTGRRYRTLAEEVGEVAREFNDAEHEQRAVDRAHLRKELIQVAAMAGAWADALTAREAR